MYLATHRYSVDMGLLVTFYQSCFRLMWRDQLLLHWLKWKDIVIIITSQNRADSLELFYPQLTSDQNRVKQISETRKHVVTLKKLLLRGLYSHTFFWDEVHQFSPPIAHW